MFYCRAFGLNIHGLNNSRNVQITKSVNGLLVGIHTWWPVFFLLFTSIAHGDGPTLLPGTADSTSIRSLSWSLLTWISPQRPERRSCGFGMFPMGGDADHMAVGHTRIPWLATWWTPGLTHPHILSAHSLADHQITWAKAKSFWSPSLADRKSPFIVCRIAGHAYNPNTPGM